MAKKIEVVDPLIVEIKTRMDNIVEDIKGIDASKEEIKAICQAKIEQITDKFNDKELMFNTRRESLVAELRMLYDQVDYKETKTQMKVELLSGDVVIKKASKKIDYDKKKLLDWASSNGRHELIQEKITSDFKWAEFKSSLAIQEGLESDVIVDAQTGELLEIDGLVVANEPEKVVIK